MIFTFGKILLYSGYLLVGIYLVLINPAKNLSRIFQGIHTSSQSFKPPKLPRPFWFSSLLGIIVLTLVPYWYVLISLLISIGIHRHLKHIEKYIGFNIFTGFMVVSFLPWWLHNAKNRLEISFPQSTLFLLITTIIFLLFIYSQKSITLSKKVWVNRLINCSFIVFFITIYAMSISVGLATPDFAQWHHWGAYVGPAELVYNGVYPLYDIPMQYGLGPTLIIASGCKLNCWSSLFWVASIFNLIFALTLAKIAIDLYEPQNWIERILILTIILLLFIFWFSNPIMLQAPNAFPSGNGLRFLPGLLMLYLLLNHIKKLNDSHPQFNFFQLDTIPIFILWILSIAWSPEAGIHTTILVVPYFFWGVLATKKFEHYVQNSLLTILKLTGILLTGLFVVFVSYYLLLGVWPNVNMYLTYILNPINPAPVNPNGPIWIILLIIYLVWHWNLTIDVRFSEQIKNKIVCKTWLICLLCFANFSYCLGRSADGNLIAMLPYFLLLALVVQRWSIPSTNKTLSTVLLASIISWSFFPTHFNNYYSAIKNKTFIINAAEISERFTRTNNASFHHIKIERENEKNKLIELQEILKFIYSQYNESVETFDRYSLIDVNENYPPWNALYGPANFGEIPSPLRKIYLANVMKRLNKSGWIVYDKDYKEMVRYLDDYDEVYQRDKTINYNYYIAIRFVPK